MIVEQSIHLFHTTHITKCIFIEEIITTSAIPSNKQIVYSKPSVTHKLVVTMLMLSLVGEAILVLNQGTLVGEKP